MSKHNLLKTAGYVTALFLTASLSFANSGLDDDYCTPLSDTTVSSTVENHTANIPATQCATVIDLAADPDDFSPVLTHLVTTVKEALAADKNIILLVGEFHDRPAHVRLGVSLSDALTKAALPKPVIAIESAHNLFEHNFSNFLSPEDHQTLARIKIQTPDDYHRLQTLAHASSRWEYSPVTYYENIQYWLKENIPVRLIDAAITKKGYLDRSDPTTDRLIKKHDPENQKFIKVEEHHKSMYMRNLFMVNEILDIIHEPISPIVIVQTGRNHIAGDHNKKYPYHESMHSLLTKKIPSRTMIISLFPETKDNTYKDTLSLETQQQMNRPETIILRHGNERTYDTYNRSLTDEDESALLSTLYNKSGQYGAPPTLKNNDDYNQGIKTMKHQTLKEFGDMKERYARKPPKTESATTL